MPLTLQNIGSGPQPHPVDIHGNTVESTDCFTYLGCQLHSSGRSTTEIFRRIGIASSVMGHLSNVWRQSRLSVHTKKRLYGTETLTMLKSNVHKIEAFHMSCQRRILGTRWYDFISKAEVVDQTREESIAV